jgi:hypothetical protein
MQGRENQMTRQSRLNSDPRCLKIANFADHNNVRILAQDGA